MHYITVKYLLLCIIITAVLGLEAHRLETNNMSEPQNVLSQTWMMDLTAKKDIFHFCNEKEIALDMIHKTECITNGTKIISLSPDVNQSLSVMKLLTYGIQIIASMYFYTLLKRHWKLKNPWIQTLAFAVLLAVINQEFLRMYLMEIIADHRNIGYEFLLIAIPIYFSYLFVAGMIVWLFSISQRHWLIYTSVFVFTILGYQYLPSLSHSFLIHLLTLSRGGYLSPGTTYGRIIQISSFITFLLPVAGMYVAYILIRDSLPKNNRGLWYFLLLVCITGELKVFLEIITSEGNIFYRILYYGSFWWELIVISYLIVFFIERKKRVSRWQSCF